jgi:hypothetical protein
MFPSHSTLCNLCSWRLFVTTLLCIHIHKPSARSVGTYNVEITR